MGWCWLGCRRRFRRGESLSNLGPVMLDSIDVGNHVVLIIHDVHPHVILRLRLGKRARVIIWQAPHFIFIIKSPSIINWVVVLSIITSVTAILVGPSIVTV